MLLPSAPRPRTRLPPTPQDAAAGGRLEQLRAAAERAGELGLGDAAQKAVRALEATAAAAAAQLASAASSGGCMAFRTALAAAERFPHLAALVAQSSQAWGRRREEAEAALDAAAAGGHLGLPLVGKTGLFQAEIKDNHLGLPLVGKTGLFQAEIKDKCVICPAHGTYFDLKTGAVKGEWCPKLPNLPLVGKGPAQKPLPTFESRVTAAGEIEVLV
ncbi:hypothetical protein TSOC_014072 [Tetrabaena socialis]|uniref:Rieske domain-containing protein n=1 Tax=Tetrabaena socialis TaxID=47790 RepID=A0A2J7ZIM5_9CHLO|nr:hypothetical protein TSOC_014072 [Tetrabaena socialis]|eukprot:PNH00119.1 hypothetical protein TSOC_014072 [Tetrabaena socialis]